MTILNRSLLYDASAEAINVIIRNIRRVINERWGNDTEISQDYSITESDEVLSVDTSSGDINVTLPEASSTRMGRWIYRSAGSNSIVVVYRGTTFTTVTDTPNYIRPVAGEWTILVQ